MSLLCVKSAGGAILAHVSCEFEEAQRVVQMMGVDIAVLYEIGADDVAGLVTAMRDGARPRLVWICYVDGSRLGELVWNPDTEAWDEE